MNGEQAIHPARETLAAFGSGKLAPAEAVVVEAHIAECEACCETLHGLGNDTFVDLVRESNAVQPTSADGTVGLPETQSETVSDLPRELTNHPRYRILELLGRGGMGDVYRAEHTLMNRSVALKVISRDLVQNAQAVERFRREVQSAAQLAHPNIVTAHDAEQAGDVHFLVMEYVPGEDLSEVVKRQGPLDIAQACDYIHQAAEGLQHAHEKGMVHRDVKPQNLMVTAEGQQVKILDFGLAALASEAMATDAADRQGEDATNGRPASHLTSAGSMMGTPDFIAPEQATDARAADIRSDVYSLGCTFYYLLTRRPPFTEGSALERVKAHGELNPEPIENLRADIPPELVDIVRRMMAKDPADRFQTPADVAEALAPLVDAPRPMPVPRKLAKPRPSTASSRRSWQPPVIATALALAACVLAGVIYVATDNGTLMVESEDDVEVVIRSGDGLRIVDTVTGSTAKRLPSGEYVLDLKGDENNFELSKDRFLLKRGDKVIVTATRKMTTPEIRRVWHNPTDSRGKPSPDGRQIAITDWETGDVAVVDLSSGISRRLTDKGPWTESPEYGEFPVWSPDGERIAYSWLDENGQYVLRVAPVNGSQHEEVYRNESVRYIWPFAWSTDGRILAVFQHGDNTTQLMMVSVADHTAVPLTSLGWNWPRSASISPDSRYIVYDLPQKDGSTERDIYVMSTDGTWQDTLVAHPEDDAAPTWTPDGKRIVFTSDRDGKVNLWVMPVSNGRRAGPPQPVGADMSGALPMGFADNGTYFYATGSSTYDIYTAEVDTKTGELVTPPEKSVVQFEGTNELPSWSPDGKLLAYVSRRNRPPVLVIRSTETGDEQSLVTGPRRRTRQAPKWSPDRNQLLIIGDGANGRSGILSVNVENGEVAPVCMPVDKTVHQAVWFPDGERVLFLDKEYIESRAVTRIVVWDPELQRETVLHRFVEEDWSDRWLTAPHSLTISPDGLQVAFATLKDISIAPIASGKPRVVARAAEGQNIPTQAGIAWTRDGNLIYATTEEGEYALGKKRTQFWRVSVDGGEPNKLELTVDNLRSFSIHPDGRHIAFGMRNPDQPSAMKGLLALENFLPPLEDHEVVEVEKKSQRKTVAPTVRQIWANPIDTQGSPSPDGREISFTDWGTNELAVRNRQTGDIERIKSPWSGFPYFHVWSPDGKQLVTSWDDDSRIYDLRIIGRDGSNPRILYRNEQMPYMTPVAWSRTGEILALASISDGTVSLLTVSAQNGSVRTLKSLGWQWPLFTSLSPDGRYVAYDLPQEDGSGKRDIFLLATDGRSEVALVENVTHDYAPVWTPDGGRIVFTSDRNGSVNLWVLDVDDGNAAGFPRPIPIDMSRMLPMGMAQDGTYFYRDTQLRRNVSDVYVVGFDPKSGDTETAPEKVSSQYEGFNSRPAWSPDGKRLAYASMRGPVKSVYNPPVLVVHDVESGREQVVSTRHSWRAWRESNQPVWLPDGATVILSGKSAKSPWGFYAIDIETGKMSLVAEASRPHRLVWSPGGKSVFFIQVAFKGSDFEFTLFSCDLASGNKTQLLQAVMTDQEGDEGRLKLPHSLAVSPDGKQLAIATSKEILLMPTAGGASRPLIRTADSQVIPFAVGIAWTPDGKSLIYGEAQPPSERTDFTPPYDDTQLWLADVDGGEPRKLGSPIDGLSDISLHPDGNKLAYTVSSQNQDSTLKGIWALENFLPPVAEAE